MMLLQCVPRLGGVKLPSGGKTSYFEAKCVTISKTVRFTSKLPLITNRKLYMRLRLTPSSMTLDDLELYNLEFSENLADFGRNNS